MLAPDGPITLVSLGLTMSGALALARLFALLSRRLPADGGPSGYIAIAITPALIGSGAGLNLAHALAHGDQPAMIAIGGPCVAAALVTAAFVCDDRVSGRRTVPHPRAQSCALPLPTESS